MKPRILAYSLLSAIAVAFAGCSTESITGDVFECSVSVPSFIHYGDDFTFTVKSNRDNIIVKSFSCSPWDETVYPSDLIIGQTVSLQNGQKNFTIKNFPVKDDNDLGHLKMVIEDPRTGEEKSFSFDFDIFIANGITMEILNQKKDEMGGDGFPHESVFGSDNNPAVIYGDEPVRLVFKTDAKKLVVESFECEFAEPERREIEIGKELVTDRGEIHLNLNHAPIAKDRVTEPATMYFRFSDPNTGESGLLASAPYLSLTAFQPEVEIFPIENTKQFRMRVYANRERFSLVGVSCDNSSIINNEIKGFSWTSENEDQSDRYGSAFTTKDGYVDIVSKESFSEINTEYTGTITVRLQDTQYSNKVVSIQVPYTAQPQIPHHIESIRVIDNAAFNLKEGETKSFTLLVYPETIVGDDIVVSVTSAGTSSERLTGLTVDGNPVTGNRFTPVGGKPFVLSFTGGETGGDVSVELHSGKVPSVRATISGYVKHRLAIEIIGDFKNVGHAGSYPRTPRYYAMPDLLQLRLVTWKGEVPKSTTASGVVYPSLTEFKYPAMSAKPLSGSVYFEGNNAERKSRYYFKKHENRVYPNGFRIGTKENGIANGNSGDKWYTIKTPAVDIRTDAQYDFSAVLKAYNNIQLERFTFPFEGSVVDLDEATPLLQDFSDLCIDHKTSGGYSYHNEESYWSNARLYLKDITYDENKYEIRYVFHTYRAQRNVENYWWGTAGSDADREKYSDTYAEDINGIPIQ